MKIITERLIECRELLGISKQKAAKMIGVSQPTYLRYESGEREPSIHVLKEIAKVFNSSVDYLIGTSNSNTPDFIIIEKKESPEVFTIIENYKSWDKSQIKHLLAYTEKINAINKKDATDYHNTKQDKH